MPPSWVTISALPAPVVPVAAMLMPSSLLPKILAAAVVETSITPVVTRANTPSPLPLLLLSPSREPVMSTSMVPVSVVALTALLPAVPALSMSMLMLPPPELAANTPLLPPVVLKPPLTSMSMMPPVEVALMLRPTAVISPPVTIVSDPRRVRQILLNLLSNAIKFGRGKPIRVLSCATPDRGVQVEVIDQGVGIRADDQDKIFDEFVQLARSDRQEGTGLGLPISQRLAFILSGALTVESEIDVGSTFRLHLPRLADPVAAIQEDVGAESAA